MNKTLGFSVLLGVFIIVFSSSAYSLSFTAQLVSQSGSNINSFSFDSGSYSFKDNSPTNQNALLKLCSNDSLLNQYVTLAYATEDASLFTDILLLPAQITSTYIPANSSTNCSLVDIDISSFAAFYPGIPFALVSNTSSFNTYNYSKLSNNVTSPLFVGNYTLTNVVVDPTEVTLTIASADVGTNLSTVTKNNMFYVSILDINDNITNKTVTSKNTEITLSKSSSGGYVKIIVNGMQTLESVLIDSCTPISTPGYYVLNSSLWNVNNTCIEIENVSDVTFDLQNNTLDGLTNITNGSYYGIQIINSRNVTIRGQDNYIGRTSQQFICGVYLFNSTGNLIDTLAFTSNTYAICFNQSSSNEVRNTFVSGNQFDILMMDSTNYINSLEVPFSNATTSLNVSNATIDVYNLSLTGHNIIGKSATSTISTPDNYVSINEWYELRNYSSDSWAFINFTAYYPLPNNGDFITLWLWKADCTNTTNNVTNTTNQSCTWSQISTATRNINVLPYKVSSGNVSDFSLFAPLALQTPPVEIPAPQATPSGGGGGESQVEKYEEKIIELDLTLRKNKLTILQGGTGKVKFLVENIGDIDVKDVTVLAAVPTGWKTIELMFGAIKVNKTKDGTVYITVNDRAIPTKYIIPVKVLHEGRVLDIELLEVTVIPQAFLSKLSILESPLIFTLYENRSIELPLVVKNSGEVTLNDVKLSLENLGDCVESIDESTYNLKPGESGALKFNLKAKQAPATCNGVIVLTSQGGTIAFTPISMIVAVKPPLIRMPRYILPFLFIIWTGALLVYYLWRKR